MSDREVEEREAQHGQKMIELVVRLWTDEIAHEPGKIRPKHAWTSGVVGLTTNHAHGIKDVKRIPFNSILDLTAAIEQLLVREGITLHLSRSAKRYTE